MPLTIKICLGSACFARGNAANLAFVEQYLQKNPSAARIELIGSRCEEQCAKAPNITIAGTEYPQITREKLAALLGSLPHE
ncbi:MAG: (2Fe-2S) ferredoxin domain-containing protein [Candidatus Margulisbacteria bacterium]|jgi:NADH:ubiquinone oxidoreductase subunit E|nr:(2Fe-2S) ferredoxin domain-containing protein [Candidatus Margulisiibacteriota bacterium]